MKSHENKYQRWLRIIKKNFHVYSAAKKGDKAARVISKLNLKQMKRK